MTRNILCYIHTRRARATSIGVPSGAGAFRPTCGMPSGGHTTDLIPAALGRIATTSRAAQKLKCLQGMEQTVPD